MSDLIEQYVCNVADLPEENDKKAYTTTDGYNVLLIKQEGKLYATGTKCTHLGAPLVNSVLVNNGRLRCQWHGAEFNLATGDIEEFPAFNCLPSYEVIEKDGKVFVKGKSSVLSNNKADLVQCTLDANDKRTFLIVGGGAAGFQCAETLRQKGYRGRLVMFTAEDSNPYDRTKLSKLMGSKIESLHLRPEDYYRTANIEVVKGKRVTRLCHLSKTITLEDNSKYSYNKIFLSTGVYPRRYYLPGSNLKNIFYLRNHHDANNIIETAKDKDVLVIGTSFIGMEVAANLVGKAKSVTMVGRSNVPFKTTFSNEVGQKIKELFESKGIEFNLKCQAKKFIGNDKVEEVIITGKTIKTDMVVLGIGVEADVAYLENSGINFAYYNNVVVNNRMETSIPDIYAGGDMVAFPLNTYDNKLVNIGHWQLAQKHGKTAALNMLNIPTELNTVPFYWSLLFGKGLRMAGYTDKIDDVLIHGSTDMANPKFIAFHFKDDKVVSVVTMGFDPLASYFASLLKQKIYLKKDDIKKDPLGWAQHLIKN